MGLHDDSNNPLNGVAGISTTAYNLKPGTGEHLVNLLSKSELEHAKATADVTVYEDYDASGALAQHPFSHLMKRLIRRLPKALGVALLPSDMAGSRYGAASAENLAFRRHASTAAAVADAHAGNGDGITALAKGDALRSGTIHRANMLTAAQLQRGYSDRLECIAKGVELHKLYPMQTYLRHHLIGSDGPDAS